VFWVLLNKILSKRSRGPKIKIQTFFVFSASLWLADSSLKRALQFPSTRTNSTKLFVTEDLQQVHTYVSFRWHNFFRAQVLDYCLPVGSCCYFKSRILLSTGRLSYEWVYDPCWQILLRWLNKYVSWAGRREVFRMFGLFEYDFISSVIAWCSLSLPCWEFFLLHNRPKISNCLVTVNEKALEKSAAYWPLSVFIPRKVTAPTNKMS
jgi:hypothetical protein